MNTAGIGLKEPSVMDWDNYNPGSKYQRPPEAKGVDGKALVYTGQLPQTIFDGGNTPTEKDVDRDGFRSYLLDPIKLVKNGGTADGYVIRFTRASVKNFERNGVVQNASPVGNLLKSAGVTAKPQRTAEYDQAMLSTRGRVVTFTIEWQAKNKDTGEEIWGYDNFPNDPERPGQKKAILRGEHVDEKTGEVIPPDTYTNKEGQVVPVKSEVLFANARVRYFVDGNRGK